MNAKLFLTEQIIAILIFAICAAICVNIFTTSYFIAKDSKNLSNALLVAESGAESYKAASGGFEKTASILSGSASDNKVTVYYNKNWEICEYGEASYLMLIEEKNFIDAPASVLYGDVSVKKLDGDELIALTAAARRNP